MWPWSTIRLLRNRVVQLERAESEYLAQAVWYRKDLSSARGEHGVTLAKLELASRQIERLEVDLAGVQADHRGLIAQMVGLAHGRTHDSALNLNPDPFAEESKQKDDWVQPEDADIDELTEMLKSQETGALDGA